MRQRYCEAGSIMGGPVPASPSSDRITFVGHSTVRLELGGTTFLTDPLLRPRFLHVLRHAPPPPPSATKDVDAVLISHLHPDHLDIPSVRLASPGTALVPAGGGRAVRRAGLKSITELRPGDSARVGAVEVRATSARHDGRRYPVGRHRDALGFELRSPARGVYFAGDTDLFDQMGQLEDIDLALLPISGWGPRVGAGHLDPRRAAEAAALIRPRVVVPIHWGTYLRAGLARRRPGLVAGPAREFAELLIQLAPEVTLEILEPGASLDLP